MPGVAASHWYGDEEKTTRSPVRVGCDMSAKLSSPFGILRASALVKIRSIGSQPSGWPSPVQSLGSESASKAASIRASSTASWLAGTCWNAESFGSLGSSGSTGSRPARFR